ncbi:MAG TPA: GMP/IMP nucleotidase [Gammaproteobacteria bacterium]
MIDWYAIDTVLLDMDGTLLDLHFDNHFWQEHVPLRYAQLRGLTLEQAKGELAERYRAVEGTLHWYCMDYWARELTLDIEGLKREVDHLIAVHPHVVEFLTQARHHGKRLVLVTNAHVKSLGLKMERTRLAHHFDQVISSHELGMPKEHAEFWAHLQRCEPFDAKRTLFVDDSLAVLRSAQRYGIAWLLAIRRPDTRQPLRQVAEFPAINDFSEIMPVRG